jgi:hypothetical protein
MMKASTSSYYISEPHVLGWLRAFMLPDDVVLDVGSGDGRYRDTGAKKYISLDSWPAAEPDYLLDLNKKNLPKIKVSVALMIDVLEHLPKDRGLEILLQGQRLASRAVVVLAPLVWDENVDAFDKGFYQDNENILHKSLWDLRDFHPGWTRVWLPSTLDNFFGYWVKN